MNRTSGAGAIKGAARPAGSFILLLFAATSRLWGAAPELEFHCSRNGRRCRDSHEHAGSGGAAHSHLSGP